MEKTKTGASRPKRVRPKTSGFRIPEALKREAWHAAIDEGQNLTEWLNDAIRRKLGRLRAVEKS